jgi:hypothetical protein
MDKDTMLAEFLALSAQIEQAQKKMTEKYQAANAEYERLMNEAVQRYQKAMSGIADGGSVAAGDDADATASEQPQTFEEGADDIYTDIGTADG